MPDIDDEWLKGQVRFAPISASQAGDTVVVPAEPGKRLRVVQFLFAAENVVSVKFKSGETDLTGFVPIGQPGWGISQDLNPIGYFLTNPDEPLIVSLSDDVPIGGVLGYRVEG
jgi:hypothetical protein